MKIKDIYYYYGIPENLQNHMLRVAGMGDFILDHWHGPSIAGDSLIRVLLLHDMGNLVKIVEHYEDPRFQAMRDKYIALYGTDDHVVSEVIGRELGLTEEEIAMMNQKIFMKNEQTMNREDSSSFLVKIGAYCDQRVAPDGILSLRDRMEEGKLRYRDRPGTSFNHPQTDRMIECAYKIEEQVMQYCDILPEEITNESIAPYIEKLKTYEIKKEEQ